jgi:aminoglycoside phosphotransferase (APT) family kinase protein
VLPDDAEGRLSTWLTADLGTAISALEVTRLDGGHSSGAWRLDVTADPQVGPLVLKAPVEPSPVYRRDAVREARIIRDIGRRGVPVPTVHAVDDGARSIGRPCFVMQLVEGRSPADEPPVSYHADPWLLAAGPEGQRAVWETFHDALAALHRVDPAEVPDASLGPDGLASVLAYWRASLLDVLPAEAAPRQLGLLDWLRENLPAGADDDPAPCMGDARLVNCLVDGTEVRALIDFEIAYIGNPAADIGYCVFLDGQGRATAETPLTGIPAEDETWRRWERATGRAASDRAYWKAFGAMMLAVTATRFMVQLGLPTSSVDAGNPVVSAWEACVAAA